MKTFQFSRVPVSFRLIGLLSLGVLMAAATLATAEPIHDAARKGDAKKIKAILQADPKAASAKDKNGDTPLHLAALHGQIEAAQVLLEAGADVNAKNNYGPFTPGDLGQQFSSNNHQDPVILLSVHGVDQRDMKNGYTPLDLAEFSTSHKKMVELLVSKGADVNAQSASGATPLFWAVMRDQKDDAQFLLEKGANVNTPDAYGDTILDCALHLQFGSMIQLLVDKGADVNAKDQSGTRPLGYALGMDDHKWAELLKKKGAHE
jgi:ankyrin repeat protein